MSVRASTARVPRPVALVLPGQGSQHQGMASGLYGWEPGFTAAMDEFFDHLGAEGRRLRADWLRDEPALSVHDSRRSQPLLLAIGHAMGRMVRSWGLEPQTLLGHSVGEYAAAVLAGVMDLPEAARLIVRRIDALHQAPPGAMYAVAADARELAPYLGDGVVIGAFNGPRQVLVCGPEPRIGMAVHAMERAGFTCVRADADRGFHSPSLREACVRTLPLFAGLALRPPRVRLISGYTAAPVDSAAARDPWFWAMQPARPVFFGPALDRLLSEGPCLVVEAGPGRALSALARRHPAVVSGAAEVVPLLGGRRSPPSADRGHLLRAMARFEREGHRLAAAEASGGPLGKLAG